MHTIYEALNSNQESYPLGHLEYNHERRFKMHQNGTCIKWNKKMVETVIYPLYFY